MEVRDTDPRATLGPTRLEPLLTVDSLDMSRAGNRLVQGVSLALGPGEVLGLVGESGSGKSLTALAIMGLLPPAISLAGSIRFQGERLSSLPESRLCAIRGRLIGMVFQEPMSALNPVMTIGAQVAETLRCHKVGRREAAARADEVLTQVGLPPDRIARDRYPHELSGGQRQRVAIAIAIAMKPSLLIADEPTTALDATTQLQILGLLSNLVAEMGMGLLLISHDLTLVAGIADRVAVMQRGEIVEQGAPVPLFGSPRHPYTRSLIAATSPAVDRPIPGTPSGPPLLEARSITCDYRLRRPSLFAKRPIFRALDHVSLSIGAGESVGLVGESGSGKSTLVRILLGLARPQSGEVRIAGEAFSTARPADRRRLRQKIQVVFQDPFGSFDPRWRVEQLVSEPFALLDRMPGPAERRAKIEAMLQEVGLKPEDADRYPHEFSGGQRQRIAIARALIINPALVVLDEATSALDRSVKAQILTLLGSLSARHGLSYLFVSHDLDTVRRITDRVLVMQQGRIVESGPTRQIFEAPQQAYTKSLLAVSLGLDAVLSKRFGGLA